MLTDGINFKNFNVKAKPQLVKKKFELLIKENNEVLKSLSKNYQNSFSKNLVSKYKKFSNFRIIGLGGSTLGSQAIYQFLFKKIKKKFVFIDNLDPSFRKNTKTKNLNLIISKSGNTIETIANANILINKNNRLGGKISIFEMGFWNSIDIDHLEDFKMAELIMKKLK